MNLNTELPDDLGAAVNEQALAQGISPGRYVSRVLENMLGSACAAVWYLFGDPRPSVRTKHFIGQAAANRRMIEISPISLAEVLYLVEK